MKRLMAIILTAALIFCLSACSEKQSEDGQVSCTVTVSDLTGTARTLRFDGVSELLSIGSTVSLGDSVITDRDSTATLTVDGTETSIILSPSSEILFKTAVDGNGSTQIVIALKSGSIANSIDMKLEENDVYEVCTGDMTMAIRGTDAYVEFTDKGTAVALLTGTAYVFNYADGKTYTVPAGVQGCFNIEGAPEFEFIDIELFGKTAAAEGMLKKVADEDKDFSGAFEKELRDNYAVDNIDYNFTVDAPVQGVPNAGEAVVESEKSQTTVATTTTTTATTTATTIATTTEATGQTTSTTAQNTASSAKTTKKTSRSTAAPAKTTTTTTVTTTTTTTTTVAPYPSAERYQITLTGLYYEAPDGQWVAITEYVLTAYVVEANIDVPIPCQYNGENFLFTVNWKTDEYTEGESYRLYADSFPETYTNIYTNISAEPVI